MTDIHKDIKKAIHRSQHCQRNWDLTKEIPQEDLELMLESVTQCPSKQNKAFYKIHCITNRDIIEKIHENTVGFGINPPDKYNKKVHSKTNPQVLANSLFVFESYIPDPVKTHVLADFDAEEVTKRDQQVALGIAAGYLNFIGSYMGYSTGCCQCFNGAKIQEILDLEGEPMLLMGVGISNPEKNRRFHHVEEEFKFPTIKKSPIPVNIIE